MNVWTPERELRLAELWDAKAPLIAISEQLGVTLSSIVSKANQIGLPRRASAEWPDDLIDRLTRLWAENYSAGEIGRAIGKSRNAVLGKAHRIGLSERRPTLSNEERIERQAVRIEARKVYRREYKAVWAREERAEQRGDVEPRPRRRPGPKPVWGGSLNIPLLDLGPDQCRFSYSATTPFLFCGQPTLELQSWCPHCSAIVHVAPQAQRDRKPFRQNGWIAA